MIYHIIPNIIVITYKQYKQRIKRDIVKFYDNIVQTNHNLSVWTLLYS